MSTLSQFTQGGKIKSIQRGVILISSSNSASVIINSVDTSKSILYYLGQATAITSSFSNVNADYYLTLTNSTTITASGGPYGSSAGGQGQYVSWQLVEYY